MRESLTDTEILVYLFSNGKVSGGQPELGDTIRDIVAGPHKSGTHSCCPCYVGTVTFDMMAMELSAILSFFYSWSSTFYYYARFKKG